MLARLFAIVAEIGIVVGLLVGVVLVLRGWNKHRARRRAQEARIASTPPPTEWAEWAAQDVYIGLAIQIRQAIIQWMLEPHNRFTDVFLDRILADSHGIIEGMVALAKARKPLQNHPIGMSTPELVRQIAGINEALGKAVESMRSTYQSITLASTPNTQPTLEQMEQHSLSIQETIAAMNRTNATLNADPDELDAPDSEPGSKPPTTA